MLTKGNYQQNLKVLSIFENYHIYAVCYLTPFFYIDFWLFLSSFGLFCVD